MFGANVLTGISALLAALVAAKTGLVYIASRKYDTQAPCYRAPGLGVYCFTAIDFRAGKVIWERQLGTGFNLDGFEPPLSSPAR